MTTTATPVLPTRRSAHTHPAIPDLDRLNDRVAWLSGLRRDDSGARASAPIVEVDRRGLVKVNPMAAWPADDAVDCWPCTELPAPGADPRSGRWAGSTRTECGLHL